MGLGVFEGIRNLEEGRNRVSALTAMLTSRSLLFSVIDSWWNRGHCVRMHDVVRDVCTKIGKNDKYIGGSDCAWYSSNEQQLRERSEFRGELEFPNLRLLLLFKKEFKFDSVFLEGIADLHVLRIENSTLTSLPHAPQRIKNLQTLVLESCSEMKTISVVGELVNLKILVCRSCDSLEELPTGIKRLNRLKLLELTECDNLKSIGRGIISSLVGLEELKMMGSFKKWEAEDSEERKNAGLRELEALTSLTCLEIEIEDPTLVAQNMHISAKLERFHIGFDFSHYYMPGEFDLSIFSRGEIDNYDKKMSLKLGRETCLGDWIEMHLLRETEYLSLSGNGAMNVVNFGKSPNMRCLRLSRCDDDATLFPATSSTSFQNLSSIEISYCPRLHNLAMLSIAGEYCLSQLEKIYIHKCMMMEQVLLWKEENNNSESRIHSHVKFPKLKEVRLYDLPNLATFCQGIEGIAFPQLREIFIYKCPKWKSMVISNISSSSNSAQFSSHLFCQPEKVSFGNLKELHIPGNPFCGHKIPESSSFSKLEILSITEYHGSRSFISSSIATNLANLKTLSIERCDEMVEVVKDEDEEDKSRMANINVLFPKLEKLILYNSPKLASFCELKCDVSPLLRKLYINSCPKMTNFSIAATNLEEFSTDFDHQLELRVSFDKLKTLRIEGIKDYEANRNTEYPFYHHKLFKSLVHGLEELYLWRHRSMSLFPCSVAGELVNLRVLRISNCCEMVTVIEEEAEEKVASGGRTTLLFPKLEELWLSELPKLVCFCEMKSGVKLPSLSQVEIKGCPNMKRFSSGPLTAPNLKSIHTDYPRIGGEKDLNVVLQQQAKKIEEEEEKEKKNQQQREEEEGGEEAHESKGEI